MALPNLFGIGSTITSLGTALGLPEFGIGEKVFGVTGKWGEVPVQSSAQTPPPPNNIQPNTSFGDLNKKYPPNRGNTGGGGGSPPSDSELAQLAKTDRNPSQESRYQELMREFNARSNAEAERTRQLQEQQRQAISSAYDPIFSELDRQVGLLPEQRKAFEEQISTLGTQQKADIGAEETQRVDEVSGLKSVEEERAKEGLRGLEQDVRNLLSATGFYLGSRGAADSSAPGVAGEGIIRGAQQARAKILSMLQSGLSAIDQKVQDVKTLAQTQSRKVDDWKANKLFEVGQWASDRLNTLNSQKASATGEKARAIADMIANTQQQFIDQLRRLDDAVLNYKTNIATWQTQREGEMEDFRSKLQLTAQYTPTAAQDYKIITDKYGRTFAVNPKNPTDVKEISGALTPNMMGITGEEEKKNLLPSLIPAGSSSAK